MNGRFVLWNAIALTGAVSLAAIGRGNWLHQVLSMGALLWIGSPLLFFAVALAIKRRRTDAMLCIAAIGFIALQLGMGMGFLGWDIRRGKDYCEALVPMLDRIHEQQGRYPLTLEAESSIPPPPPRRFGTSLINYYSTGETFTFEVNNPAEIFGGFVYRHDARYWEEWRD